MHQKRTSVSKGIRERNFRISINYLATKIYLETNIPVFDIEYIQYLQSTDASRLTRVKKIKPKGKSRIKCTIILCCSFNKLCRCKHELNKINKILACQWDLIEIIGSPDKCGISISFNPHNIK